MRRKALKATGNNLAENQDGSFRTAESNPSKNEVGLQNWRKKEFSQREMRGLSLVAKGNMIKRTDDNTYVVRSSDMERWYKVSWNGKRWICQCKDHEKRLQSCKHVYAVLFLSRLPYILMANFQSGEIKCPKCNSTHIIRKGLTHSKEFASQRYQCKEGKHKFTDKGESKGLKGNPLAVIAVADLYFKGLSLRAIEDHMNKIYSLHVSYPTIHRWIRRTIKNMKALEKEHSLRVGKRWHIDETEVRIAGKLHYLWNALDAETKILLASEVTYGRSSEDAEMVIREALRKAETTPDEIVTDGLKSYNAALSKDYGCRINHISKPKFTDPTNNNLVERVNGTMKTRIKGFRRLDNLSSSAQLFDGLRLYYNHKRPHSALGGKTPVGASSESAQKRV
jgi:putative transposase